MESRQYDTSRPLGGITVLDLSRMLPGAVLVRQLVDLGARVIKVEDAITGDLMRLVPPMAGGTGVGFAAFFRGVESVCLDPRQEEDAGTIRRLLRNVDVLVESFRPGTMKRWGLGPDELRVANPSLVVCSIPGYDPDGPCAGEAGHDLNFIARSGLLDHLGTPDGVPTVQLADFTAGLLAANAVLAALVKRGHSGTGTKLTVPLARAPLPWLSWTTAEHLAGGAGAAGLLLGGGVPSYRVYACADDRRVALGALEPKFWAGFVAMLGLEHLAGAGLDPGHEGEAAATEVARVLAAEPAVHWLRQARELGLPLTLVATLDEALTDPCLGGLGIRETVLGPDGSELEIPGPWLPMHPPGSRRVPGLGEDTAAVLEELAAGSETAAGTPSSAGN